MCATKALAAATPGVAAPRACAARPVASRAEENKRKKNSRVRHRRGWHCVGRRATMRVWVPGFGNISRKAADFVPGAERGAPVAGLKQFSVHKSAGSQSTQYEGARIAVPRCRCHTTDNALNRCLVLPPGDNSADSDKVVNARSRR